jgi:N-acetylglutamate synthase/N-acetylornithine aminotransferase
MLCECFTDDSVDCETLEEMFEGKIASSFNIIFNFNKTKIANKQKTQNISLIAQNLNFIKILIFCS